MTALAAAIAGYLLGGLPTADWLASMRGVDLRTSGSGNPGANNALRVGGRRLAASVLALEVAKGIACVLIGGAVAAEPGMAAGGVGAVLGNVANPYRQLRGGQGLGMTAGVLGAALPVAALTGVAATALVGAALRRSAPAALTGVAVVIATAAAVPAGPWGITTTQWATSLATGIAVVVAPKQLTKLRGRRRDQSR